MTNMAEVEWLDLIAGLLEIRSDQTMADGSAVRHRLQ